MSDFFTPPPSEEPEPAYEQPVWIGPPANELGVSVPGGSVLMQRGGGGGGRSWSFRYWLWLLPPPGPLTVVVDWPLHEIPLTRIELDAEPLRQSAALSEALWPGGGPDSGGGFTTAQISRG